MIPTLTFTIGIATAFFAVGLAMHGAPFTWAMSALVIGAALMFGAMFMVVRE